MWHAQYTAIVLTILTASSVLAQEPSIAPVPPPIKVAAAPFRPASADRTGTLTQYIVECELHAPSGDGQAKFLHAPSIVVTDGQEGHIAVEGERSFITGIRSSADGGAVQPVISSLREGMQAMVLVTTLGEEYALVDVSFTISTIEKVNVIKAKDQNSPATESPQLSTTGWRLVRTISLGESIELTDQSTVEGATGKVVATIKVDRLGAEEAAITPIAVNEQTQQAQQKSTMYAVAYSVEDLLAPYAQAKPEEELQDSDYVLVMNMILSEALAKWPVGATIRPVAEQRTLIISQTRSGHQQIAKYLRDHRDNVALIEQHLRR